MEIVLEIGRGGKMKRFLLLILVLMCGCSSKVTQEEMIKFGTHSHGDALVIIEARIVGGGDNCDKYCYYDIEIIKVIKNSVKAKLDSRIKVAIMSYGKQPELNKTYTLELDYYNDHPEYGFTIIRFKEK
jgi:hypothetical protein